MIRLPWVSGGRLGTLLLVVWLAAVPAGAAAAPPAAAEPARIEALALAGVDARAAAYLLSGQSGGGVQGEVIWTIGGASADDRLTRVLLVIEVDGSTLLGATDANVVPVELYGYILNNDGAVIGHLSQGLLLERGHHLASVGDVGCRFLGALDVEPGRYSLRIMVRNRLSGRFFLARRDIDVPPSPDGELSLLPPLVADSTGLWVEVRQHGFDTADPTPAIPGPGARPSARPVWPSAGPLELILGSSPVTDKMSLRSRLIDTTGRVVLEPPITAGEQTAALGGLVFYRASIPASDVPNGSYRLMVDLTDIDTGRAVSQSLPVILTDETSTTSWTAQAREAMPAPEGGAVVAEEVTEEDFRKREIRRAYLAALRLLADGDEFSARRAVAELERRTTAVESARGWMHLREVELRTTAELSRKEPASVMAVVLLHSELYSWYVARRRYRLAEHSRTLASDIAEAALRMRNWSPPKGFTEAVLLDLSGDLARAGQTRAAYASLLRVVQLNPESAPALLGLGAVYERSGDVKLAAQTFQQLVDAHPDHREARLRLATCRARLGSDQAARGLLSELLRGPAPQWIHTIAYQELGRLLIEKKRLDEAEAVLREGVDRRPRNQRLRIQLAYTLDQAGRWQEALELLEELGAFGGQTSTSPRVRYAEWPDLGLEGAHQLLTEIREPAIEALGKAVGQ